jgi:hypothetical protein
MTQYIPVLDGEAEISQVVPLQSSSTGIQSIVTGIGNMFEGIFL